MKSKIKQVLSLIFALIIFVVPFGLYDVSCVSAVGSFSSSSSYTKDRTSEVLSYFYNNPYVIDLGFTPDNSYFVFTSYNSSGGVDDGYLLCIKKSDTNQSVFNYNSIQYPALTSKASSQYIFGWSVDISNLNSLGTYHFTSFPDNGYKPVVYSHGSGYQLSRLWQNTIDNPYPDTPFYNYIFDDGSYPVFNPDEYEVVNPFFSLDVDDFYTWLVNNDKIEVSGSSGGVSVGGKIPAYIGTQKLKSFLTFYKNFGSSNKAFSKHIVEWFSFMNIVGQTKDNINVLKTTIDALYQEYINYRSGTHAYWPTATKIQKRQNIDTVTDDDNTTLITDDNSDPLDISILRDILRGVIAISNNVNQGVSDIVSALNRLDFTVNVANSGGEFPDIDLSSLYTYDSDAFSDDLETFSSDIEDVQNVPQGYIDSINQNRLMPENMLEDKSSLTVNVPTITGFTVGGNGSTYSTQTGSYVLRSIDYPWLDTAVQKIKRFASILLIMGYLVHLRYRIPELIRGE